ncbi:MAG: hypothetical protein WDN48_16225 [Pseudolabrys sp.]
MAPKAKIQAQTFAAASLPTNIFDNQNSLQNPLRGYTPGVVEGFGSAAPVAGAV